MDPKSSDRFTSEPTISTQKKLMACENCGHLNPRSARVCAKCGARFGFATYVQAYAGPALKQLGLLALLGIPAVVVCLIIFTFIAGHLGYGAVARKISNYVYFALAGLGLVILALGGLILTYNRKRR